MSELEKPVEESPEQNDSIVGDDNFEENKSELIHNEEVVMESTEIDTSDVVEIEPPTDLIEETEPVITVSEATLNEEPSAKSTIDELEKKREAIVSEILSLEKNRDVLTQEIEEHIAVREDLNQWITARRESFAWKLMESLKKFRAEISSDEDKLKNFSKATPILDRDYGIKIRKFVMSSIGVPLLVITILIVAMEIIRRTAKLINVPDPNNPAASILVNQFDNWLLQSLGLTHLAVIAILVVIFLLIFIGVLFSYMRKSSEFRFMVSRELKLTKTMEEAAHYLKTEREKIDSLHPQVPQILELLSLGLHQPWMIDQKYLDFQGELPDTSKLPESLDIAIPTEKSSKRVFPTLVLRAMNQIQQVGWRSEAFDRCLQKLAESSGFGEENSALRQLDQDQRRNGKRQMIIDAENKELVLTNIGDQLVKDFALEVQAKVLPFSQPDVMSLRPNELAELQLADNLVADEDLDSASWDKKLAEIAGAGSPWAPGTFSAKGQIAARHEHKPESVFIATDRSSQLAHKEVTSHKEVQSDTRPFEVSIRVDLSEWCHPEEVAVFQDYQPSQQEIAERIEMQSRVASTNDANTENSEESKGSTGFDSDNLAF